MEEKRGYLSVKRIWCCLLLITLCAGLLIPVSAYAAVKTETKSSLAKKTETKSSSSKKTLQNTKAAWYQKKGYYYYKNQKGKIAKGLTKIDGKHYLFDSKGRQLNGWRTIGGDYYFFYQKNGLKGYMVTKKQINGVWLRKNGKAKVKKSNRWKLQLMAAYQNKLDTLVTPVMSRMEKLKEAFNFAKHKKEDSFGTLQRSQYGDNWYLHYAEFFLNNDRADCYTRGCGLAFLANAIGCKNVKCVANWGHGFCEINNKVFDPSFAKPYSDDRFPYFNGSYKVYSAWAGYPFKVLL